MTEATLNLDARQRAMLDEMGVKVWWPTAKAVAPTVVETPPAVALPTPAATAAQPAMAPLASPSPAPAAARAPAPVAAAAPATAARSASAVRIDTPRRLYAVDGQATGGWLIVADMPPESDGRQGEPFDGDAGRLLDNMLRALRLHVGDAPVHLVRTHRAAVGAAADSALGFDEAFAAQAAALAPRIVLAMGPLAAQSLLQSADPLGKLRGRAMAVAGSAPLADVPLVATYHPLYLLRNPADKGRAWADLCLAAATLESAPS